MAQRWRYPLTPSQGGAGTAVTATGPTSGFGAQTLPQLPPLDVPNGRLVIEAQLEQTWATTGGTVTVDLRIGTVGQAIGSKTVLAASSALSIAAGAAAWPLMLYWSGRFRTLSPSAGVVYGQGWIKQGTSLTAFATPVPFPVTQALRTVSTLNTDQVNELDLGITLSTTTGSPSITMTDYSAEYSG
jgi:hypothetical protein